MAASLVVLAHLSEMFFQLSPEASRSFGALGSAGMTLFFVLSGFVIHYNYRDSVKSGGLVDFFIARFARIYPLYLVALLADFATYVTVEPYDASSGAVPAMPFQLALLQTWIYWPMGDRALHVAGYSIGPISWSISTEWFFYICYPVVLMGLGLLKTRRQTMIALSGLILTVVCLWTLAPTNAIEKAMVERYGEIATGGPFNFLRWMFYFTPYARTSEFLLGALTAHLFVQGSTRNSPSWAGPLTLLALAFALWLQIHLPAGPLAWSFGIAPFIALTIYLCARYPRNGMARALSCRPIATLGGASYSLYLLHPIILGAFRMTDGELMNTTLAHSLARSGLTLTLILGLSLGSYRYFETPVRQFIRGMRPKAVRRVRSEAFSTQ